MKQKSRERGERDIHARSGGGNKDHVAARMMQRAIVDGHGFGVSEKKWRAKKQKDRWHQDRAERVDVLQRIEGHSAKAISRVVAQEMGDEAVRGFVQRDSKE